MKYIIYIFGLNSGINPISLSILSPVNEADNPYGN